MKKLLTLILLFSASAFGQTYGRYQGMAFNQQGRPQPGVSVAVCGQPATTSTTPCSPLATLYTDSTGITACNGSNGCSNPTKSDGLGNFFFYAVQQTKYTLQFYGPGLNTYSLPDQVLPGGVNAGFILGNQRTVIDLAGLPNAASIAATDLAQLFADGQILCGTNHTCVLDTRGMTGTLYPLTTFRATRPLDILWGNFEARQTVEAYQPAFIIEPFTINGAFTITGLGLQGSWLRTFTNDDAILSRNNATAVPITIENMLISAASGGCNGQGDAIDLDAGYAGQQDMPFILRHLQLYGYYAFRENIAYYGEISHIRGQGCAGFDLEGGNGTIDDLYSGLAFTGLTIGNKWRGSQWIANEPYVVAANPLYMMLPGYLCPHVYVLTAGGTSGATPPACQTTPGGFITDGRATWQESGTYAWGWRPGVNYLADAWVTEYEVQSTTGNNLWQNTAGPCTSGTTTPPWAFVTSGITTETSGTPCTWKSYVAATGAPSGAAPGQWDFRASNFEVNGGGNGFVIDGNGSYTFLNTWFGITTGPYPGGLLSGGAIVRFDHSSFGWGGAPSGLTLLKGGNNPGSIHLSGTNFSGQSGVVGIDLSAGCPASYFEESSSYNGGMATPSVACAYPVITRIANNNTTTNVMAPNIIAAGPTFGGACTNAELALSGGWGSTAAVSGYGGLGGACHWTITSSGTGQGANPTITDTLTQPLYSSGFVCDMHMTGGTGTLTMINQTTMSATAPVFTFLGTPVAASTYVVVRSCGQ